MTRGWLIHSLGCAAGIAAREGDRALADHLVERTLPLMELQGDGLPRGVGAELAVALMRILGSEPSQELRAELVLSKARAIGLELERAAAEREPLNASLYDSVCGSTAATSVLLDEEQIRLLLQLVAPEGGGYHPDPLRGRTQAGLSVSLEVLSRLRQRERTTKSDA